MRDNSKIEQIERELKTIISDDIKAIEETLYRKIEQIIAGEKHNNAPTTATLLERGTNATLEGLINDSANHVARNVVTGSNLKLENIASRIVKRTGTQLGRSLGTSLGASLFNRGGNSTNFSQQQFGSQILSSLLIGQRNK